MKLWLISQTKNTGWDTFDCAVVAAETDFDARNTYPGDGKPLADHTGAFWVADPSFVTAKYIGEATDGVTGVVCASFNAG